jgi:hypothetical protein
MYSASEDCVFCHLECFEGYFVMVNKLISICLLLDLSFFFFAIWRIFLEIILLLLLDLNH